MTDCLAQGPFVYAEMTGKGGLFWRPATWQIYLAEIVVVIYWKGSQSLGREACRYMTFAPKPLHHLVVKSLLAHFRNTEWSGLDELAVDSVELTSYSIKVCAADLLDRDSSVRSAVSNRRWQPLIVMITARNQL